MASPAPVARSRRGVGLAKGTSNWRGGSRRRRRAWVLASATTPCTARAARALPHRLGQPMASATALAPHVAVQVDIESTVAIDDEHAIAGQRAVGEPQVQRPRGDAQAGHIAAADFRGAPAIKAHRQHVQRGDEAALQLGAVLVNHAQLKRGMPSEERMPLAARVARSDMEVKVNGRPQQCHGHAHGGELPVRAGAARNRVAQ